MHEDPIDAPLAPKAPGALREFLSINSPFNLISNPLTSAKRVFGPAWRAFPINKSLCPSFVFVILPCRTRAYRTFTYLLVLVDKFRTAMMQVPKDTPGELAALTKPLEPAAKRVPKKQLKEKVTPRAHAMVSRRRSGACIDCLTRTRSFKNKIFEIHLKFI